MKLQYDDLPEAIQHYFQAAAGVLKEDEEYIFDRVQKELCDSLLTGAPEIAATLGVSECTFWRWMKTRRDFRDIIKSRPHGRPMVKKSDLLAWVEQLPEYKQRGRKKKR